MNWRRGLLLAGIQLVIAGTLIAYQEVDYWRHESGSSVTHSAARIQLADWQESDTVTFDPCNGGVVDHWLSPPEEVVSFANIPASAITGWVAPCPSRWTLAGILRAAHKSDGVHIEPLVASGMCALVPLQWFLVGGFPFIRPRKWWQEPGAFITLCTCAAFVLLLFARVWEFYAVPALMAAFVWLYWFGLLVWKTLRSCWRRLIHPTA
jgi:hypothetical protein